METIRINVNKQMDGYTFSIAPSIRQMIKNWFPNSHPANNIFVVQDDNGTLRRVQVKTSTSTVRQSSFSGQFNVPLTQLKNIANIPVHYGNSTA
ncbi:MAG: hypothetical protein ACYCVH_00450 [Ignavibacteriaceae bacterium]